MESIQEYKEPKSGQSQDTLRHHHNAHSISTNANPNPQALTNKFIAIMRRLFYTILQFYAYSNHFR
jgi:hypothetical protein